MISEESKTTIDALSKKELQFEVNLGRRSRFQGEKFAYLQTRLEAITAAEQKQERQEDRAEKRLDRNFSRFTSSVAILTSILSLVVGGGWYQQYQKNKLAQQQANEQLIFEVLQPISTLLSENEAIYKELKSAPFAEPDWGILDSYLIKIRREQNVVKKNAYMKSRIDLMVKNNATILTMLKRYIGKEMGPDFGALAQEFRDHATRYESRWQSLLEIYQSDGYFPTAEPVFPKAFPQAIRDQISLRQNNP